MATKWTPKQLQAIESRDKTLLVSAAAGSGKTATLTERIIRRLTDKNNPASISRLLVVTFTRLSAADLKRKISNAISGELANDPTNKYLSKQLVLLESARICTIDSFYLDIVRSNFQRLSLPSNFRLADEGEMALLRKEVMDGVIEKIYDLSTDNDDGFLSFVEHFTSAKQSDTLSDVFLALHDKLSSRTEGISAILSFANELTNEAEGEFFESRQGKFIHNYLLKGAKSYLEALQKCCDVISSDENSSKSYLSVFAYEKSFMAEFVSVLEKKNYAKAREHAKSFIKQRLGLLKKEFQTEEILACKSIREEADAFIKASCEKHLSFDEDSVREIMRKSREILLSLHSVLKDFEDEVYSEKMRRRAFDFNDVRRFAYQLLTNENGEPSDIALNMRDQFDEIYIDEYQDVDAMQDRIFTLIAKENNRFMVGDIKQSIYSFRGADPDVFAGYKKNFPEYDNAENSNNALIFMSNNFRCDDNVIKFTNTIFSFLFGHAGESIEYTPNDELIFSKVEEGRTLPSPKVNIAVVTGDDKASDDDEDDERPDINPEAIWIANEIYRLIQFERKADGTKIEPRDIAILMRSTKPASDISRALALLNIPCSDNSKHDLFETPDVLLALSLLSTVDNPHRDIPLTATLYSPIFNYTMDELIEIRTSAPTVASLFEALKDYSGENEQIKNKNAYFLEKLSVYRRKAASLSIDKLLNYIYRDLSMTSFETTSSHNLTRLYEMARKFEAGSFKGLNNFISYINELIANNEVPSLTYEDAEANAVQMITAHKSKGLEFPVCFICNTQSSFNFEDIKANLLYNSNAGIALRLAYEGGMARLNTPLREAVALEITNAQIEEEMRVLYVALTRARERLYVTAHTRSRLEKLAENAYLTNSFASDFKLKKCKSWLSMILASIYPLKSGVGYNFIPLEKDSVTIERIEMDNESAAESSVEIITSEDIEKIRDRIEFRYSNEHLSKLPAKLSVSKLTPTVLDDIDNDAATLESFDEAKILEIEEFFESKSKTSSAERGTATHLFLQFCDFENAEKNGIDAELSRLVDKRFIAPQIAELINKKQIGAFFESDFYRTFKNAKRVYREQRFNILLPASHFTQNEDFQKDISNENILVQGVIDLFFENEDGSVILCDYKTDYLTTEELGNVTLAQKKMKERHGKQLEYYAMAIERLLGKAPDKILIYSLPLGEAIDMA